jgi:hypothetical protein
VNKTLFKFKEYEDTLYANETSIIYHFLNREQKLNDYLLILHNCAVKGINTFENNCQIHNLSPNNIKNSEKSFYESDIMVTCFINNFPV